MTLHTKLHVVQAHNERLQAELAGVHSELVSYARENEKLRQGASTKSNDTAALRAVAAVFGCAWLLALALRLVF